MKLTDIPRLPTIAAEAWYDAVWNREQSMKDLFGFETWSLDTKAGLAAGDGRVRFCDKLSLARDGGRFYATVSVAEFDGRPFAVLVTDGKRGDVGETFVTDRATLGAAAGHLLSYRAFDESVRFADDAGNADRELSIGGATVVVDDGRVSLVDAVQASADGVLLFRERRFAELLRTSLQGLPVPSEGERGHGMADADVRAAVAEAIAASVPDGVEVVPVDRVEDDGPQRGNWVGAVVATDEGTYAIGLDSWNLSGGRYQIFDCVRAERIGGPEEIEAYRGLAFGR